MRRDRGRERVLQRIAQVHECVARDAVEVRELWEPRAREAHEPGEQGESCTGLGCCEEIGVCEREAGGAELGREGVGICGDGFGRDDA